MGSVGRSGYGHELIDRHLAALAPTLPRDTVDELADGLAETGGTTAPAA